MAKNKSEQKETPKVEETPVVQTETPVEETLSTKSIWAGKDCNVEIRKRSNVPLVEGPGIYTIVGLRLKKDKDGAMHFYPKFQSELEAEYFEDAWMCTKKGDINGRTEQMMADLCGALDLEYDIQTHDYDALFATKEVEQNGKTVTVNAHIGKKIALDIVKENYEDEATGQKGIRLKAMHIRKESLITQTSGFITKEMKAEIKAEIKAQKLAEYKARKAQEQKGGSTLVNVG